MKGLCPHCKEGFIEKYISGVVLTIFSTGTTYNFRYGICNQCKCLANERDIIKSLKTIKQTKLF